MRSALWFVLVAVAPARLVAEIPADTIPPVDSLTALEYAAKFVCGPTTLAIPPVAPGRYFTAINIHNPSDSVNFLRFKVALTSDSTLPPHPGPISAFDSLALKPDQAVEIDCRYILRRAQQFGRSPFAKGFLVIHARRELDVVGVYTAVGPTPRVQTMALERVPVRSVRVR